MEHNEDKPLDSNLEDRTYSNEYNNSPTAEETVGGAIKTEQSDTDQKEK
ncbi:hypothetical protein [Ornithinibacillus scapharcae]|nr:hypothetical protein [Ornithinibacillus scapharcae]